MAKKSKYILVTGASAGIGLAITKFLAEKGDYVIATDKNKISDDILEQYNNIDFFKMDLANHDSILLTKKLVEDKYQEIDALVNNAGIFVGGPLVEIDIELINRIFAVNVFGTIFVTQVFFPLIHRKKGRIINISSEAGRFTPPFSGPYSMVKYTIESFSDALRRELMFVGVKVSTIQPGAVKTDLLNKTPNYYITSDSSLFSKQISRIHQLSSSEWKRATEPNTIAKLVYKVIHTKNPKPRYKIKNNLGRRVLEYLPDRLVDKMIKIILR
ncbi:MAG: SDR family NAD(P)-dependent oxidoreductase [Candidatus Heimdallarchaeum endolithica]|uniref:SDR family NAD(P)-dependent oxidoreductase n=1 Tax=Candidatus Heimdallarchaeum endolithica TaxID=2876572 RepID=A0A9Y1BPA9_9ARCH|nr:MAG: SDR family NAD(P)-dependent oxidoreductase [Candidatus Heimdallarchaeum endolithica]